MSFILEALNKAERNHSTSNNGSAPQVYPLEKQTNRKGILLLLIVTVCLTSAAVSLLIIYMTDSKNGASHIETQNTQKQTPTVTRRVTQQTTNSRAIIPSAATDKEDGNNNFITRQEPGFSHLISRRDHSKKTRPITDKPNHIKTKNVAVTAAHPTSSENKEIQKNNTAAEAKNIGEVANSQLTNMEISVHMYSKTPAKRFVYINSTRYGENALISDGIILNEITENGIILNINGTLYRMPIK